ncbi:hypothetical protein AAEP93_007029 [Penicillium crustosum]
MSILSNSGASLIAQLASPPNISLQLLGTHTAGEQTEVDFDLWIDCSKEAKIKSGEFLTGNGSDHRFWDQSGESDATFLTTSSGWVKDWLGDNNKGRSWTLRKIVGLRDDDSTAIKAHAEGLARSVAYGGSIIVQMHTSPAEADVAENTVEVRAEWSFDSPFFSTEKPWSLLIMDAMVDRKRGFITVDEPRPSDGRSAFRRAMKFNNTSRVISEVRNDEGFTHTVLQFSKWGSNT